MFNPSLPSYYFITPEPAEMEYFHFMKILSEVLVKGISLVQLRSKLMTALAYTSLAETVLQLCHSYGAKLILNPPRDSNISVLADGMHLTSQVLMKHHAGNEIKANLVSAACHNLEQLEQAVRLKLDFVTLSPVLPTKSHPMVPALGWEKFKEWVSCVQIPVYALGGMNLDLLPLAFSHGAQGIAGIRSFSNF